MRSYENRAASSTKRTGAGALTNGQREQIKEVTPPQTAKGKASQAVRANTPAGNQALRNRTGQRETILDDITPVNTNSRIENGQQNAMGRRDSHDLSISSQQNNRDSLVDHMLLSFDQFSMGPENERFGRKPTVEEEQLYSTFGDEEEETYLQNTSHPRLRNASDVGHQYSYSSDYENADDSSRHSEKMSRDRRSNSSLNFQSAPGRRNSVRNEPGPKPSFAKPATTQNASRASHSRGGKGSKGSSANSLDLGYPPSATTQRRTHGMAGRSSSFDYGSERHTRQPVAMNLELNSSVAAFDHYDYDAAPTPTVPGGPRRIRPASPIFIPQPESVRVEQAPQKLERKRSTRSSKSAYKGKVSSALSGGRLDHGLSDRNRELPPMPAFIKGSPTPAPLVGRSSTMEQPAQELAQPSKDRPGFFRRVFGSSKTISATMPEPSPSLASSTSVSAEPPSTAKPNHIATQFTSHHAPPPPREPPPPPKEQAAVITKKPSSFFRRRKKSVSEAGPVPLPIVLPIKLMSEIEISAPLPSPVSSLRKVMNPYLKSSGRQPPDPQHDIDQQNNDSSDVERHTRGFSPDYEPDKAATIRAVKPSVKGNGDRMPIAHVPSHILAYQPNSEPSDSHDGQLGGERDGTFLQDSYDNIADAHSRPLALETPRDESETNWLNKSKVPPNSAVARDMALVAAYERVHSKRSPTPAKTNLSASVSASASASDSPHSTKHGQTISKTTANEEWVALARMKLPSELEKENRVWLEPSSSEEDLVSTHLALPEKATNASSNTSGSTETLYKSATSLPIVKIEGEDETESLDRRMTSATETIKSLDESPQIDAMPVKEDLERAQKIYDGNEDFISKEKAAAWMGDEGIARTKVLAAYMDLYEFCNLNILVALRKMCSRLVLKAESQQVDRILDAFAQRWCQCNSNHGFKATDVVHTICYSILLLNTDLHLADIDQKMTRSQFVKNTMPTIRSSAAKAAPNAFEPTRPTVLPGKSQAFNQDPNQSANSLEPQKSSIEIDKPSWRSSFKPPARTDSGNTPTPLDYETPLDDCGPLVKAPFHGTLRTWEVQVEIVLKDFFNSIRNERLPLFGATAEKSQLQGPPSNTLSVFANGMLRRTPSVLSKTPSESQSYIRGRTAETLRVSNSKFGGKNRSRPRFYPNSGLGSSRTSLDDQSSMWSPSVSSSTWSKYSLGKTQTSLSVDSTGSSWPHGEYQQSIGFANALSQAIIREETTGSPGSGGSDELRVAPLLEDESLGLAGAPWAKEGILKYKHHLEALDKKAKDRNWNEVFAVIEKGYMSLFSFSTKSMRNKSKGKAAGGVVGGGNWQESAESLGSFLLRQTIASALPSPGYSKARPHVWALSLPTGAVHLFQVGTPDIVKEFVSTANYWSARLSNHPLVGGISNIEYGWSDSIVNNALITAINDTTTSRPSTSGARPSMHSSLRSSLDLGYGSANVRPRLPGDRVAISDWSPPTQSMRASNLMEPDQLRTLLAYVSSIEEELQNHNQLRSPMLLAFTPRHPNSQKAMANWEKKSSYLLREIVKFRTYIDCLQAAEEGKARFYAERSARQSELEHEGEGEDADADETLRPE